jgi:hypothetical protein
MIFNFFFAGYKSYVWFRLSLQIILVSSIRAKAPVEIFLKFLPGIRGRVAKQTAAQ